MASDIEIAQGVVKRPIAEIAATLGLAAEDLVPYGRYVAKIPPSVGEGRGAGQGRIVLVTAMTPTPRGEGKTTNTIGLAQALARRGRKTIVAVREPSLGPCMGVKGGAAGGGYSQILPMEDINLHFTGDLHAVTAAHNLLAAILDNHLHQKGSPPLHPRRVVWQRVIDMNDRSLRRTVVGLEGGGSNGVMREDGFEITAASEVMAVLCLARDLSDLKRRLGDMIVGYDDLWKPVTAGELRVNGAMTALLKHALLPNLVQTVEGVPAFVHGGPFANIAHGCNSVIATRLATQLADYTVTEAGFGADLGAEKFLHIKCRTAGLEPSAAVLVVTRRAFELHGIENVMRHVETLRLFGVPVVVSVNRFAEDRDQDLADLLAACQDRGVDGSITDFREAGGEGGLALAEKVERLCQSPPHLSFLYDLGARIEEKIEAVATRVYGAGRVELTTEARRAVKQIENLGYGGLPICVAKTPASLTDDPKLPGRPRGFTITVTGARVSAGAGFVVVYCGQVMTMPGLPREPAALAIDIDRDGVISGLF